MILTEGPWGGDEPFNRKPDEDEGTDEEVTELREARIVLMN